MADRTNPSASKNLSSTLLPNFYRTDTNKKFLEATIEQLTQAGTVKKINGFIGRKNSKATQGKDVFIDTIDSNRMNYQLEPAIVIDDELGNTNFYKDYIDYINQLSVFGADVSNHDKLNRQEFYSWNPHINWDKFSNFQNYYWLPYGPETIRIYGQQEIIETTYSVNIKTTGSQNSYVFGDGLLGENPTITLYRGQTYKFDVNSPGNPLSIKSLRSSGDANRYANHDIENNTIEHGTIILKVSHDTPSVLYYQSEFNTDLGGVIHVKSITENTEIDIELELLGKKTYTLSDGTHLSNGMKICFGGEVTPSKYAIGNYYVEGVGTSIKLVDEKTLEIIGPYTTTQSILFDSTPFDSNPFSDATSFAGTPDYIVINRSSIDQNPWSRHNRWFHKDVIETSARLNGKTASLDQTARAVRAIIEFDNDLKLFNYGTHALSDIDLIDTYTTDVFSTIEGSAGYNIDGISVVEGQRILFTADTDMLVKNKIYEVEFYDFKHLSINTTYLTRQIHLKEVDTPIYGQVALIHNGVKNQGVSYWFDGLTWIKSQQKTAVNQPPLFDIVDSDGDSYGDKTKYDGTTFIGTKLFSYKVGNSITDPVLGFPLSYKNVNNIGDIVFEFNLLSDKFNYKDLTNIITKKIDTGYLIKTTESNESSYVNGWERNTLKNIQAAIRIYKDSGFTSEFELDIYDDKNNLNDLQIKLYVNGNRLESSKWSIHEGPVYKKIVLLSSINMNDILTIRAFSDQPINKNGFYEIPLNLQNNPLNESLEEFTLGEINDHILSIVDNTTEFTGSFPGASNLRDLGNLSQNGTKFVQHSGPLSLSLYHITNENNNIIRSIEKARDDYGKFKRNFITVAHNLGIHTNVDTHVDLILSEINKDKPNTYPYYFSDMIPYGAKSISEFEVIDYRYTSFPLKSQFDLNNLSNKAVIVYHNSVQLLYNKDYEFEDGGFVNIKTILNNNDKIIIHEYDSTDGCFIPETPTKLGIWPKYEPRIYLDTTLMTPRNMIQCHDGSLILAYEDFRDDLILELEKRIYNNIKVSYDRTIFDVKNIQPSYNRETDYGLSEFNKIIAPNFYKWTTLIDRDFSKPLNYDRTNPFSYNYIGHNAPDGRGVPGYWREIYRWMLDTDRPHICPWEMLGFTVEPSWWIDVYGKAPYTSDNLVMWGDIASGTIKEPGKPSYVLSEYKKPFIIDRIPVDELGNLLSPMISGLADGIITPTTGSDFVFGDGSPIETTWRRSSYFPFDVIISSMIMTPSKTFGLLLDRSRITRDLTGNIIYKDTGLRITPKDIKLPNIVSSNSRVQTAGIINYIINYILSDNLKSYNEYFYDLASLKVKLGYRVGAFTSDEKFNLILDSKTPLSSGSVFIPHENYKVILNTSSNVNKITYSGVIITKVYDGFELKGYSRTQPYFKYYPWIKTGIEINIGGISESYMIWEPDQQYVIGKIVKYNNVYYRVKSGHITTTIFDNQYYQKLANLPVIGGRTAYLRKLWDRTTIHTIPYNTKFREIQDVVDFLLGYGEYLKDQGFIFDDFNVNLSQVSNWETSAKEFLFWTTQNWSSGQDKWQDWLPDTITPYDSIVQYNGEFYRAIRNSMASSVFIDDDFVKLDGLSSVGSSVLSVSPAAEKITFNAPYSVVDSISNNFNGYEIYRVDGQPIQYEFINSYREDNSVSYTPSGDDGIYGASFYLVQTEHVIIFDNSTMFNDTIYNPVSGYRQERMKVSGYVSIDWNGSFDVPGFIFDSADIANWNSWQAYHLGDIVKYKEFYYAANEFMNGTESFDFTKWVRLSKKPTPKLLPNWNYKATQFMDFYSLDSDNFDTTQQKLAQHLIGYQKRQYLENIIQDDVSEFKFYQGMINDKGTQNVFNKLFDVLSEEGTESLQFVEEWAIRQGMYGANESFENIEIKLDQTQFKTNPQGFEFVLNAPTTNKVDFIIRQKYTDLYLKPAGYNGNPWPVMRSKTPYLRSAGYVRKDEVLLNIKTISDLTTADITQFSEGDYVWCSFDNAGWNVYRFTNTKLKVISAEYSTNTLKFIFDGLVQLHVGDYIGIKSNTEIDGFHIISDVSLNTFSIIISGLTEFQHYTKFESILIFLLTTNRVNHIDNIDPFIPLNLMDGEQLWIDDDGTGNWSTMEYKKVYSSTTLRNQYPSSNLFFGKTVCIRNDGNMAVVSTNNGEVITYDKVSTSPFIRRQTIAPPFISNIIHGFNPNDMKDIATVIVISDDGRWMITGTPNASKAAFSSIDGIIKVSETASNSSLNNHGIITIYEKDKNNLYTEVMSILSPIPTENEMFGRCMVIKGDTLYISSKKYSDDGITETGGIVYKMIYSETLRASAAYDPVGSNGKILKLSSVIGISSGMKLEGNGFTNNQYVESVNLQTSTIIISDIPDTQPYGIIQFKTYDWKYDTSKTKSIDTFGYGYCLALSDNTSSLIISSPGNNYNPYGYVYIYKDDILTQTINGGDHFGSSISISSDGTYVAISDTFADLEKTNQGSVKIYKNNGAQYEEYQELYNVRPETNEYFGTIVSFMNSDNSIMVYSSLADSYKEINFSDNTSFDSGATIFLTSSSYDSGRIDIYDKYSTKWVFGESIQTTSSSNDGYGSSISTANNLILVSAPLDIENNIKTGSVYVYTKPNNIYSWSVKHHSIHTPDVRKIKQAYLYDTETSKVLLYLDILDPNNGKIPTIADNEIKYKTFYDPAIYVVGDGTVNVDDGMAWKTTHVGTLWWDLRTTKFISNNDEDIVYRNSNSNTLAAGSTVDVYEWVESIYIPSEWDKLADTEYGLTDGISGKSLYGDAVYSLKRTYDNVSMIYKNKYYFWVKNKTIVPNVSGRNLSANNISQLIGNPRGYGYQYIVLTGTNSFSLVNVKDTLRDDKVVLSVEYWTVDDVHQNIHSQWKMISNDEKTTIPDNIEQKWMDSLCGRDNNDRIVPDPSLPHKLRYGIENRPRQSMFVNRFEALKQHIEHTNLILIKHLITESRDLSSLSTYDREPSTISGMYDSVFDTDAELRFSNIGTYRKPKLRPEIENGRIVGILIIESGFGYINAPYIEVVGSGSNAKVKAILDSYGRIIGADIIKSGVGYTDATVLIVRNYSVLVHSDTNVSNTWSIYSYDPDTSIWSKMFSQTYDTRKYWKYVDWYADGVNQFSLIKTSVETYAELSTIDVNIGDIIEIKISPTGSWELLEKYSDVISDDWTKIFRKVGSHNGTIQISSVLYEFDNTGVGYDNLLYDNGLYDNSASTEMRIILNTIKNDIFNNDLKSEYINLFFTSLRYILSEQIYVDWIFKTSFIKAKHNVGVLGQRVTYKNDNLANFEEYVSEVKPYRTKIREYVSSYSNLDISNTGVMDFDLPIINNDRIDTIIIDETIQIDNNSVQKNPWKSWLENNSFTITSLVLIDGGEGYISEPTISINSKSGSGASARAFISNGRVNRIVMTSSGSGFLVAPTITITGGLSSDGRQARAIAIIGNSKVRSTNIKLKFDRVSANYEINNLTETEQFIGTSSRTQFQLVWGPDVRIGKSNVIIDGIPAIRDTYDLSIIQTKIDGKTMYSGRLTFNTAPKKGSIIKITYIKDWSLLNSADRISYYYNPQEGGLGKDLSQLMSGIDYGGVIIDGMGFNVNNGWDSTPYLSDKWDSVDATFDDITIIAVDNQTEFELPYIPGNGVLMTVYVNGIRIDDQYYDTSMQTNSNALMRTILCDGVQNKLYLPSEIGINTSDIVIFRKSTSDGSKKPNDFDIDTSLSGGSFEYYSASGLLADDIIVDGDGFNTTTNSLGPDELIPGHVVDTVAIKIYDRPVSGTASINVENYISDGITNEYDIHQVLNSPNAIIVKITSNDESKIITQGDDYEIDFTSRKVVLSVIPEKNAIITIFEIGISGDNILEFSHVISDGSLQILTNTIWITPVASNVYVDGELVQYELVNHNGFISIKFNDAPPAGKSIDYIIVDGTSQTFVITHTERIQVDGRDQNEAYPLQYVIGNKLPTESNMLVRVDQRILQGPTNSYYTIKNNRLIYSIDKTKVKPYSVDNNSIQVFADGKKLKIGAEYSIDFSGISIKLVKSVYNKYNGKDLIISIINDNGYFYIPKTDTQPAKILFAESYDTPQIVEVISSYRNEYIETQVSNINSINPLMIISDTPEYYYYKNLVGGLITLEKPVINESYVWVIKNELLLIPGIHYKLDDEKQNISLKDNVSSTDKFTIITYNSNIVMTGVSYMMFKDMLNRVHYKRLNLEKQTALTTDLKWNDVSITVEDSSKFDKPNKLLNKPGVIEIRGERIEFFEMNGNVLSQIRRGTLGTGVPSVHKAGSVVQEIGPNETIPYSDNLVIEQVVYDGNQEITLEKITPSITDISSWFTDFGYTLKTHYNGDTDHSFDQTTQYYVNDVVVYNGFYYNAIKYLKISGNLFYPSPLNSEYWSKYSSIPVGYYQTDDIEVFIGGYNTESEWRSNVNYKIDDIVKVGSYLYRCIREHTSENIFDSGNWHFFIGNIRLKKKPFVVHNTNVNPYSPAGDVQFDADFSFNKLSNTLRITNKLSPSTIITVIKREGNIWDEKNKVIKYLQSVPGSSYTSLK